jgi:hypothetical protein
VERFATEPDGQAARTGPRTEGPFLLQETLQVEKRGLGTSDLIQKFAAQLSARFTRAFVLVVLVGQGRQCLLRPRHEQIWLANYATDF